MKHLLLSTLCFLSIIRVGFSQENKLDLSENVRLYNEKIEELDQGMKQKGFKLFREEKLKMSAGFDYELNMELHSRILYAMVFVGDPSSDKIVSELASPQTGTIINDRLKPKRDNEFWVIYQFPCELTALYRYTVLQKNELENPLGYFMLYKKVF